jgi:phenylalanyl-tRNA synthetase beta chain
MKVPLSWLREYVDCAPAPAEVAKLLVMAGVGVESIEGEVLDLEITANRADLLSMLGVAREVGVLTGKPLRVPEIRLEESGGPVSCRVEVTARDLCPRYSARVLRGLKVGPSPDWMARRLEAAGVRPVNNVVDVTNYVLLETGQPLHAFDLRAVRGGRIVVRRPAPGEKIVAIDGREYALTKDMLVIADAERASAIAGVMGGKESEIGGATTDVLLESAQFDPVSVRRTSRRLGLSSDASYRFERGVDYDGVDAASRRAAQLILQLAGGRLEQGAADVSAPRPERPVAQVRSARVSQVLGLEVKPERIREILTGLGASVAGPGPTFQVTAPAGRRDLKVEVDYVEEVARIVGYDRIPCDTSFGLRVAVENPEDLVREEVRATLAGLGAYEALTWSFAGASTPNRVSYWTDQPLLPLKDPQGQTDRTLREALAPSLLEVLQTNEAYKELLRPVFEVAHVYRREGKGCGEKAVLGIAAPGDALGMKGLLQAVFGRLGIAFELAPRDFGFLEPGGSAEVLANGRPVGYLGTPGKGLTELRARSSVAEVDFEALVPQAKLSRPYREFNRQPPVERDLSVVLGDATSWKEVEATVRAAAPPTLESLRFLSEYRGKPIEAGQKGWAFSMLFRAADRTLTGPEVDAAVDSIVQALQTRCGARLRR